MNIGFAIAAVIGAVSVLIHVFLGGARIVRPFLKKEGLPPLVKWLFYYTFHLTTLLLVAMTAVFAWAARSYLGNTTAAVFGGIAFAAALLCLFVAIRARMSPLKFWPLFLFLGMALAALWGMYGSFYDLIEHPLA
jgi:hypothetical protein